MPSTPEDLSEVLLTVGIFLASVSAWLFLGWRLVSASTVLHYEPRRPVPWNVLATMLAGLSIVTVFVKLFSGESPHGVEDITSAAADLVLAVSSQLILVIIFLLVASALSGATRDDLGLPHCFGQVARDTVVGFVGCLAAYLPVGLVAITVFHFLGEPELHPMIQQIQESADPWLLAVGFFSAVVVAPVSEEIAFRLLLQGWLEKWEDQLLGWRTASSPAITLDDAGQEMAPTESVPALPAHPPAAGVGGMPHGALPILVSSTLFAWAHVGHSTDPFPLFVLSLFLGFVYQRTHRILPSIILHATFNSTSMLMFWLTTFNK